MKSHILSICGLALLLIGIFLSPQAVSAGPPEKVESTERCPVCGMFVAKYPNWVTQIQYTEGHPKYFDGVKDLMAHFFSPAAYGFTPELLAKEIWVKDYYSLKWIDGRSAVYVTGSDVFGPMGKEFIPFSTQESAENFLKDHHGKKVLLFHEITSEMVESMRSGHKMKGHMKK
ncbi:MAG: nitrous oxide reductase accessory protein NosL [Desulfobulbaceae bacterium]|uniref:Nitrous oxide reductase accessory protein NosL n=1 Tax=Candidatus Desulfobia pelagia TaxID=2841692 RepID=A0A8J6NGB3_9BACT|nr:nitrous oxide reductase accessory protein NosL [Candidatus Desulfobia pelagia]